jgi:hypothetical protein
MKRILFFSLLASSFSSCCWFMKDECYQEDMGYYPIEVAVAASDSLLSTSDTLDLAVNLSDFEQTYEAEDFENLNVNINITWFNGDFSSPANSQVVLVYSSINNFSINSNYESNILSYPSDLSVGLQFPKKGYYLIEFWGNANKANEQKKKGRCYSCNYSAYANFEFTNNLLNSQYYPFYESSVGAYSSLIELGDKGSFFIKVE